MGLLPTNATQLCLPTHLLDLRHLRFTRDELLQLRRHLRLLSSHAWFTVASEREYVYTVS